MDDERLYKRLESLEFSSQNTTIQLTRLNALIESETGNNSKHIDAIYKIIERHDKMIFGDGNVVGMMTKIEGIKDLKNDLDNHVVQDRWFLGLMIASQLGILMKLFFK